jgi:4-amino-4-deoxy-L-arabinose transferase-like glycosyltransferase
MRRHWPFALLAAIGFALIFVNLGSDYLWEDEGDTAALASNILKFGLPRAWDGVAFLDSDRGARLSDHLVMVSHPWLQYYLAAASFAVFGENNFAGRLPFALAGWLTILVAYLFVYDLTKNRWAGFCSAALLTSSVQFLLYCRQCRYYSLSMFFGSLLLWVFFGMRSARSCALFTIVGILLFHSQPFGIVLVGALGLMSLVYPSFAAQRRGFCVAGPVIAVFTLPWIALARHGYAENSQLVRSVAQLCGRLIQYPIECASLTPLIGIVVLGAICGLRSILQVEKGDVRPPELRDQVLNRDELGLLLVSFVTLISYDVAIAVTESTDELWDIGIRYTATVIPLTAMTAGMLIIKISRARIAIWLPLLLLFSFTKLAQMTPWIFWGAKVTTFDGKEVVEAHLPRKITDRFLNTGQQLMFFRDLWQENPGTLAKTCQFLQKNAEPGDTLITNYDWEPLYFYTRLPQALKILPEYPIGEAAQRKGLPNYVFGLDRVRWVIWRPIWEGYVGYSGEELERQILAGGARVTRVAQFKETIWENRPEIHHHRFSRDKYVFTAPQNLPPAEVFRIDWPESH